MEASWTIGDLNRRASRAVVKEFRGPIWTTGELARLDERGKGHRWLELVERGGGRDGRDAHLAAFCSATKWQRLERKLAEAGVQLRVGQRLVVAGCLDIGDRGTLALAVDDVDVDALVGDRVRDRRRLVQRLVDDDLYDANRRLVLPRFPLRVGLVASRGSDGHRDLTRQLEGSGFAFDVTLQSVSVEGLAAPRAIQAALAMFGPEDVDVVMLVRGGGAKASLDVFDLPVVAHAVATARVPVWTGIGHTGDRTVADEVAHRSLPTPSAAGQQLVGTVAAAWADLTEAILGMTRLVEARLSGTASEVRARRREVAALARSQLARREHGHARAAADLRRSAARCLDIRSGQVTMAAQAIRASGGAEFREAGRQLANLALDTGQAARRACVDAADDLAAEAARAATAVTDAVGAAAVPITRTAGCIGRDAQRGLDDHARRVASRRGLLEAYDPCRQLARGWTLTHTVEGRLVRDVEELSEGDGLVTTFASGTAASTVTAVAPKP